MNNEKLPIVRQQPSQLPSVEVRHENTSVRVAGSGTFVLGALLFGGLCAYTGYQAGKKKR